MRRFLLVLLAVAACDDAPAGRPTAANDALWKLAPEGTRGAVVMSPYAVGMIEAAGVSVRDFMTKAGPEMAALAGPLSSILEPLGASGKLSDSGLSSTKGFALFAAQKNFLAVVPLGDRDVFIAKRNGTKATTPDGVDTIGPLKCKLVTANYLCTSDVTLFDTVGKSAVKDRLTKIGARGDIELVMSELPLQGPDNARTAVVAVVQIERGTFSVRGMIVNPPKGMADMVATASKPRARVGKDAGFAMADVRPLFEATDDKLLGDLTIGQLVKSMAGPITVEVSPGTHVLDIQMQLSDPKPFTQIIEHCDEVPVLASLGAKKSATGCHVDLAQIGITLDLWVEGNTLHAGKQGFVPPDTAIAMSPVGSELANGQWGLAFWGRGTAFAGTDRPPIDVPAIDPSMAAQVRVLSMVDEIGFGMKKDGDALRFIGTVRTAFSNTDAVVAKLAAITATDVAGNKAGAKAKPIADEAPRSPFAIDLAAGDAGLVIPSRMLGVGINWIVPAILYYAQAPGPRAAEAPQPGGDGPGDEPKFAVGELTKLRVIGYATDGYKIWKEKNPGKTCPVSMKDLAAAIDPSAIYTDEWGQEMVMVCGGKLPAGVKDIAVMSGGPDGKIGTDDDIKSYGSQPAEHPPAPAPGSGSAAPGAAPARPGGP